MTRRSPEERPRDARPGAPDDVDAAFGRWRRARDADALAAVFDALAPGLLRLGVHLVGRADVAEDLVQATFLFAVERPDAFDPVRGDLAAWLAGVLARKARAARRDLARAPDPERLAARVAATPLEEALAAERSGALARALDRLDEPYRTALVLRLRHGLAPAEVAHALGISPGAARTRLSRGSERLRRLLPGTLTAPGLLALEGADGRGLAAVRAAVLGHAARTATVAGASTLTLGGLLVTKKLLIAGAALAALAASLVWTRAGRAPERAGAARGSFPATEALADAAPAELEGARGGAAPGGARVALGAGETSDAAALVELRGTVVDADDGAPVAGAEVLLVAARRGPPSAVLADPTVRTQLYAGTPFPHGAVPALEGDLLELGAQLDTIAPRTFAAPSDAELGDVDGTPPLARAISGSDGAFRMQVPPDGGTLVCRHPGYPTRALPAPDPAPPWTLALRRARTLAGVAVDRATGAPVQEEVELVFWGLLGSAWERDRGTGETVEREARFARAARTDAHGRFAVELPLDRAQVEVASAGWVPAFPVGHATGGPEVELQLVRAPYLHVTDAATGAPVAAIHLLARQEPLGRPHWCAPLAAADGRYPLAPSRFALEHAGERPLRLQVWAAGFRAAERRVADLAAAGAIEVALEPGDLPRLAGAVLLGGEPQADAQVLLLAVDPYTWTTRLDTARAVAGVRTDGAGRYALSAPAGEYVLRVAAGERLFAERLELPEAGLERVVELALLGRVEVTVADADGLPRAGHAVVLRDASSRQEWRTSDAAGRAVFADLAAGEYTASVSRAPTEVSFGNALQATATLAAGGVARVPVTVPSGAPRHAYVVAPGEGDLTRFSARCLAEGWSAVGPDGRVPIDLAELQHATLVLAHADGRRWSVTLPDEAPDGTRIELALDGPAYAGRLVDRATGAPLAGVWVQAHPLGGPAAGATLSPRARTAADGTFRLVSRAAGPHHLAFADDGERLDFSSFDRRYGGTGFRVSAAPSAAGTPLEIRLAEARGGAATGVPMRTLTGVVRREATGLPVAGALVWVRAEEEQAHGRLALWTLDTRVTTDADGAFEVAVPDLPDLVVLLHEDAAAPPARTVALQAGEAAGGRLELSLP